MIIDNNKTSNNFNQRTYIKNLIILFNNFQNNEIENNEEYIPEKAFRDKCSCLCLEFKTLSYNNCFDSCIRKYVKTYIKFEDVHQEFIKKHKSYEISNDELFQEDM